MLPLNQLSNPTIKGILQLEIPQLSDVESFSYGGIALNDASQGLLYQVWRCTLVGDDVLLYADNHPTSVLFSRPRMSEVSLAFDQNMNPFVAFVQDAQGWIWWYDTAVEQQVFTMLPPGSTTPRATLDDKRSSMLSLSDIVVVYIQDGSLYVRNQRERYAIGHVLEADINLRIVNPRIVSICMSDKLRCQIEIRGNF